jgi:hypothetical protein
MTSLFQQSSFNLNREIDTEGRLKTKLYDKRDDFTFPTVNTSLSPVATFQHHISQLIRYSRAYTQYSDCLDKADLLPPKLLKQGCVAPMLKLSL